MAWRIEDTDAGNDLIWDGVEKGIAPSPTTGTANIQNANISTETGEVMASYARTAQQQAAISGGTLTPSGATLFTAPTTVLPGVWLKVTASTVSSIDVYSIPGTITCDYLIVGGGGGGAGADQRGGGGGGAGGFLTSTFAFAVGSYAVTVGAAGAAGAAGNNDGGNGGDSAIATVTTATGGGGGGADAANGHNGGSGGGGASGNGTPPTGGSGGTGTGGQGHNGGSGSSDGANKNSGGGGGGATGAGANGTSGGSPTGGDGGAGTASSITGASVTYAGGGGGGATSGTFGAAGAGGGGRGGLHNPGVAAVANTGGGGGGAGEADLGSGYVGGAGGSGIVVISYTTGTMVATGGVITVRGVKTIHTFLTSGTFTITSITPLGLYYVSFRDGSNRIKLSSLYDPYAAHAVTHGTTGSVTFDTLRVPTAAIAKSWEKYGTATDNEYRYYMLDNVGDVWVYDTKVYDYSLATFGFATKWMMPDPLDYSTSDFNGMAILNGWLMIVSRTLLYGKPTSDLGRRFVALPNAALNNPFPNHSNFAYVGHQGKMYYCDGNYIGMLFPTTSFETNIANIQSFGTYTAVTTTATLTAVLGGSAPLDTSGLVNIPVVFFTDQYGTLPDAITEGVVYYINYDPATKTFVVYAVTDVAIPLDMQTGATGNQYFNTFYPLGTHAGIDGDHALVTFAGQRVNLPYFELSTSLVEIGNTVIIGGVTNTLYPWNQIDAVPSDFIPLPERGVVAMENVNNMAYILAGVKGNIYISNGSVASHVLKVPDYCAGVPGTPLTYIEPYFTFGDIAYMRGRVYFSILDQTATKAGNTGGVWSFVPAENFSSSDAALALRLENQNSYGDYDGMARLILPSQEQENMVSPQYWAFWQDSYDVAHSATGIDFTATVPVTKFVIETDLLATGSFLAKQTFQQLEYKMTTALQAGDLVTLFYRLNSTDAWAATGAVNEEATDRVSGYSDVNFQKTQWAQFRAECTTGGTTASSFDRLKQLMLR